jgi:hypothetical protein
MTAFQQVGISRTNHAFVIVLFKKRTKNSSPAGLQRIEATGRTFELILFVYLLDNS